MMRIYILFLFLLPLISCRNEKERAIVGKWNAAQLVECDDLVPLTNTPVNLEFKSDGSYTFNSTLNVHEAGEFYIKKNHLYTQDKVREKATQKIVKIQHLVGDTLVLEMNYKGKEQWLTLVRQNEPKLANATNSKNTEKQVNDGNGKNAIADSKTVALASPAEKATVIPPAPEPPKAEVKQEPKKEVKKDEDISPAEAYRRREALRQKEEAERKQAEKDKRDAYLKREALRQKEEKEKRAAYLEREAAREKAEHDAYLAREAKRKKEEAERKRKSK